MAEFAVELHEKQSPLFDEDNALFTVCVAGRRFGKTYAAAYKCIVEGLRAANKFKGLDDTSEVMYIAPTLEQARGIFWPVLQKLARPVTKIDRSGAPVIHQNSAVLTLVNGVRIRLRGADNPDRCRGFKLRYVVMDEYADMPKEMWEEIIMPALADCDGGALFIGTPKGRNHFYEIYMKGMDPKETDYCAYHFATTDNPYISKAATDRMTRNLTDENRRQEIEASFISGGSKYIPIDKIKILDEMPDLYGLKWGITVDPNGFKTSRAGKRVDKKDDFVICLGAVHADGMFIADMQIGSQWTIREAANRIVRTCRDNPYAKLGIEQGVLLNALDDYLSTYMREYNTYRTIVPLKHGNQHKFDRMEASLAPLAQKGRLFIVRGDWNEKFLDQCASFPDPLAHDDTIDAASYLTQLIKPGFGVEDYEEEELNYFDVVDSEAGY